MPRAQGCAGAAESEQARDGLVQAFLSHERAAWRGSGETGLNGALWPLSLRTLGSLQSEATSKIWSLLGYKFLARCLSAIITY